MVLDDRAVRQLRLSVVALLVTTIVAWATLIMVLLSAKDDIDSAIYDWLIDRGNLKAEIHSLEFQIESLKEKLDERRTDD